MADKFSYYLEDDNSIKKMNHFEALQVGWDADPNTLDEKKEELLKEFNPERNSDASERAGLCVNRILEAYSVLSDPDKRKFHKFSVATKPVFQLPGDTYFHEEFKRDNAQLDDLFRRLNNIKAPIHAVSSELTQPDDIDSLEQIALDLSKIYRGGMVHEDVLKKQWELFHLIYDQAQTGGDFYALYLTAAQNPAYYMQSKGIQLVQQAAEKGHILALQNVMIRAFAGHFSNLEESIQWGLQCLRYLEETVLPNLKKETPNSNTSARIQAIENRLSDLRQQRGEVLPPIIPRDPEAFKELVDKVVEYRRVRGGVSSATLSVPLDLIETLEKNQSSKQQPGLNSSVSAPNAEGHTPVPVQQKETKSRVPTKEETLDFINKNERFFKTPLTKEGQKRFQKFYEDHHAVDQIRNYSDKLMDVLNKYRVTLNDGSSKSLLDVWVEGDFGPALEHEEVRQFIMDNKDHFALTLWAKSEAPNNKSTTKVNPTTNYSAPQSAAHGNSSTVAGSTLNQSMPVHQEKTSSSSSSSSSKASGTDVPNNQLKISQEQFDAQIIRLQEKIGNLIERGEEDVFAATALRQNLILNWNAYKAKPSEEAYQVFKTEGEKLFKKAHETLDKHRGWSPFLVNLALGVFTAGIGLLVKGVINKTYFKEENRSFFFVHKTKSAQLLDDVKEKLIDNPAPGKKP